MTSRTASASRLLRVGVLGCGYIARIHLAALARTGRVSAFVADADRGAAQRLAAEHDAETVDPEQLADLSLDVAFVCTPHDIREEWLVTLANAVSLVVCEKPLALTMAEAERIALRLGTRKANLVLAFNQRFMPGVQALRAWLADEQEAVSRIRIDLTSPPFLHTWAGTSAHGGGILVGLGSHAFDLWRHLVGGDAPHLTAQVSDVRQPAREEPDTAVVVIDGGVDRLAPSVITLQDSGSSWWSMEEGRMLDIDIRTPGSAARVGPGRIQTWRDAARDRAELDLSSGDFLADWGYVPMARAIRTAWERGLPPRDCGLADFDDGLAVARMVERARTSARPRPARNEQRVLRDLGTQQRTVKGTQ